MEAIMARILQETPFRPRIENPAAQLNRELIDFQLSLIEVAQAAVQRNAATSFEIFTTGLWTSALERFDMLLFRINGLPSNDSTLRGVEGQIDAIAALQRRIEPYKKRHRGQGYGFLWHRLEEARLAAQAIVAEYQRWEKAKPPWLK